MLKTKAFFIVLASFLVLLNLGNLLLRDIPDNQNSSRFEAPDIILGYQSEEIPLRPEELAILAPAKVMSRKYTKHQAILKDAEIWDVIWLNMLEAGSIGTLHNFYDSLIASGTKPERLGTIVLPTRDGPLRTTLIRYYNARGQSYYLLLWYQWDGGNAESRWRWYAEILKLRIQGKKTPWRLVEIATPNAKQSQTLTASDDINRLKRFAVAFYEFSNKALADKQAAPDR